MDDLRGALALMPDAALRAADRAMYEAERAGGTASSWPEVA
jgi:hypothetical protein